MCEAHLKPATSPTGYNHLIIVFAAPEEPSAASQWHCETIGRLGKARSHRCVHKRAQSGSIWIYRKFVDEWVSDCVDKAIMPCVDGSSYDLRPW